MKVRIVYEITITPLGEVSAASIESFLDEIERDAYVQISEPSDEAWDILDASCDVSVEVTREVVESP